jgi:phosphonate ABC transporter permease subunit PhnE
MKTPRSAARTVGYVLLIVVGLLVYAYGWKVTDINIDVIQDESRQKRVILALRGLLNPILFERDTDSEIAYAYFYVPCQDQPPHQPEVDEDEPYIELTPLCGDENDLITIEVFNFHPYSQGYVRWTPPGRSTQTRSRFRTDGDGRFKSSELRVPTASESEEAQLIEVEVEWPVGSPRPSGALTITIERMIETVFLALMATTMGLAVAIPVSFLAAFNIMRPIRKLLGSLLAAALPLLIWALLPHVLEALGAPAALEGWLSLEPMLDLFYRVGFTGLLGLGALVVVGGTAYLVVGRLLPTPAGVANPALARLVRYVRLALLALSVVLVTAVLSGLGVRIGEALGGFMGGVLSSVLVTVATFARLILPAVTGLAIVFVLGSVCSDLVQARIRGAVGSLERRGGGLILGAAVGALFFYLAYTGVFSFYNPGDPTPFLWQVTVGGAVLAGIGGLALGSDYSLPIGLVIYYVVRTILNGLRSIEPLIMGMVFVIWVSIGPFAGVLALALHSIAALGKLYSEQVESIDPGPVEAITATGATRLQMIRYGVVPQIVPPYIAFTLYRWDINVRMSTIIGFVGGGGIGFVLQQWINLLQYREAGVAVLAIAVVVAALDYASAKAREKIA